MGQKRKKRVAVVQCAGGCRAEMDALRSEWAGDCRQMSESSPEGICKWGCLDRAAAQRSAGWRRSALTETERQKWTGRNAWAAVYA